METLSNLFAAATTYLRDILAELQRQNRFDLTRQQLTQRLSITLQPGEVRDLYASFRSLTVLGLTGASTGVFMSLKQGSGQSNNEIFQGLRLWTPRPEIFVESATFTNNTASVVTIDLLLGFMDSEDTRLNLTQAINTKAGNSATYTRASATTVAASVAANTSRNAILIQHLGTAGVLHIGSVGLTTATSSVQLQPGMSYSAESGAAVGYIASAGTIDTGITEFLV